MYKIYYETGYGFWIRADEDVGSIELFLYAHPNVQVGMIPDDIDDISEYVLNVLLA